MNALEAAPIVSFENKLVKPIAESHIATHSGHLGRNVRATKEAPDVPAANSRFLLVLSFMRSHALLLDQSCHRNMRPLDPDEIQDHCLGVLQLHENVAG
jgi:hypothetical protein